MGRSPCCEKVGLKKGPWTPEEDQKLLAYIERQGHGSWRALPANAGLQRCGKSCRLRWTNYLRPDIKRGKFSLQEEQTIIQLHALLGNRWAAIATYLPKRTDNEIKNYWNTHLKKRLSKMGIDPVTHKPTNNALGSAQSNDTANLNHMAQWESARLEAEARLARQSKLVMSDPYHPPIGSSSSAHKLLSKAALPLSPLKQSIIPPPSLDHILKVWQGVWTKSNALLNSNIGNLQSPTSVFHFSDNTFTVPSTGFGEESAFSTTENNVENLKPHEVVITKENVQSCWKRSEKPDDHIEGVLLHEIGSFPVDVPLIADSLGLPSFLEDFTEDLLSDDAEVLNINGLCDNHGGCCSGNLEDNMKYWNTVI